jgi:hypothetical protein
MDCVVILFSLRCKWKWEIVWIHQPKTETSGFGSAFGKLLSDPKAPFHSQTWRGAVAATEAIAAATPQQRSASHGTQ